MKNLKEKIRTLEVKALCGLRSFLKDEKGDTNFISIAIILVVVIGIATLFITFSGDIKTKFNTSTTKLLAALG